MQALAGVGRALRLVGGSRGSRRRAGGHGSVSLSKNHRGPRILAEQRERAPTNSPLDRKKAPGWRGLAILHSNCLLPLAVVFVAIDLARQLVLLAIDLLALRLRQLAAVGRAVVPHFPVDFRLFALEVRGLAGGELSALDTLPDAVLLIFRAFPHFAPGNGVLRRGVVLVLINLPGKLVLLLVERGFVGRG